MKNRPFSLLLLFTLIPLCACAQTENTTMTDVTNDLRMMEASARFRTTAEHFSNTARTGSAEALSALISPSMIDYAGVEGVLAILEGQVIPFFQSGDDAWQRTTITFTTDGFGHEGFAFYGFLHGADGAERPFVLYVVEEEEQAVIANVLVDHFVEGRHQ